MLKVKDLIIAAGGILWQGDEVLLVHRPRYDDWSFPKGKLDSGESPLETAVREVREETGYEVEVSGFAGSMGYIVKGRPKTVLFWEMIPRKQFDIKDTDEVGQISWLPAKLAVTRLSYSLERELLEKVMFKTRT